MSLIRRAVHLGNFVNPQRLCQSFTSYDSNSGLFNINVRYYAENTQTPLIRKMEQVLKKKFPKAKKIVVKEMPGGCGAMYEIFVETIEFKELPLVRQHMLVQETLSQYIKIMHGLTLKTKVADETS